MGEGGLGQVGRGEGESDLACADLKEETVLMLVWFPPVLRTRELRRKQKQEESPVEGGSVEGMEVVVRGSVVNRLRTRELRRKQKQAESPVEGGSVEGVEVVVRGSVVNGLRTRELRRKQQQAESPVEGGSIEGVELVVRGSVVNSQNKDKNGVILKYRVVSIVVTYREV